MYIENDRLIIRSLEKQDLKGLEALRCDQLVYCYEPTFLMELQGTPEEALETIQHMDLYEDRQCITAHVIPDNKASAQCLLRNGFEYLLTKTEDWGYSQSCVADVYTFDC